MGWDGMGDAVRWVPTREVLIPVPFCLFQEKCFLCEASSRGFTKHRPGTLRTIPKYEIRRAKTPMRTSLERFTKAYALLFGMWSGTLCRTREEVTNHPQKWMSRSPKLPTHFVNRLEVPREL